MIELGNMKSVVAKLSGVKLLEENQMMQDQLVSMAKAFETSENCRAEVLEKIESERQAHAESLRRMQVNMKRFYATLSMSDMS
jgi:Skp family chaperone for outer membrane proteins